MEALTLQSTEGTWNASVVALTVLRLLDRTQHRMHLEPWLSALSALSALSGRCRGAVGALSVALSYDSYYNTVGSVGQLSRHCRALSEHQDSTHDP